MNIKVLISRLSAVCCAIGLVACATPPKVIVPFQPGSSPIRSVDIVLANPQFVPVGGGLYALNIHGWATGGFELKFCEGLVDQFRAAHVDARCVQSFWGKRLTFGHVLSRPASHVISIKPLNLTYFVSTINGAAVSPGGDPHMETLTEITDVKTKAIVWSGNVGIVFSGYDSEGTKFYSRSLIGSLQDSGAISNK